MFGFDNSPTTVCAKTLKCKTATSLCVRVIISLNYHVTFRRVARGASGHNRSPLWPPSRDYHMRSCISARSTVYVFVQVKVQSVSGFRLLAS